MTPHEATEQGLKLHQAGRLAEAEALYQAALAAQPDLHTALHLMGLLRQAQKDYAGATVALDRAIAAAPKDYHGMAQLFASRGEARLELHHTREALEDFERALALDPGLTASWNNRGLVLKSLGRHDEALVCFDRAILLMPDSVQAHGNRADTLRRLRRYDEALTSFARALAIDPRDWAALTNRAVTLVLMGRQDEALENYTRALAAQPDIPQALHGRGHLLWSHKKQLAEAIADLERLIRIAPDFPFARGSLMRLKMIAADWRDYATQKRLLDDGVRADRPVVAPFIYLALSDNPADLRRCADLYARTRFAAQPALHKTGPRRPGRMRVGYVCGEFRTHATLYLMAGLFEAHDKDQFEIFAFDNGGSDGSGLRARFEAAVPNIIDISRLSDQAAAARIAAEEIDIAVDLNGYSGSQRLAVFAHRPAPIQVSYLAYPGTSGAPYMDYILADKIVIPEEHTPHFSEKIAWLPNSYQINDSKRVMSARPSRAEAGLPEHGFVFCNFNHSNKFVPETFTRWMRLLSEVPDSVLWLLAPHAVAQENLKREAEQRGVNPKRLVFAEGLPFDKHLARLGLADLFMDGLPYGAHTTASDALWAGLPLITCAGNSFAGRVAASLLSAIGLPELVTRSAEEFESLALSLARTPQRLDALRKKLAENRLNMPLFDTARTTADIERAYRIMFENAAPKSFSV